jgi:F-type H+-transporting ATPase subunit delta
MSSNRTLARPYANACFELARADKTLVEWSSVLTVLGLSLQTEAFSLLLEQPGLDDAVPVSLLKEVLADACADAQKALGNKVDNFLALLCENKRLLVLPEIAAVFAVLQADYDSLVNVEAICADPITDTQSKALKEQLEKRFNTHVSLDITQDTTLIGGMILKSGNWVMDGSIKGKIERLNEDLLQ